MAGEFDRRMMENLFRTTLSVSLGAAYKGFEMLATPAESIPKMADEMKTLLTVPDHAGDNLQQKLETMAGMWLSKGAIVVAECKSTGDKFTEGGK